MPECVASPTFTPAVVSVPFFRMFPAKSTSPPALATSVTLLPLFAVKPR